MGAVVTQVDARLEGGEPVADIVVAPGELRRGDDHRGASVPAMVDELPLLACLATRAAGETTITGADELRVKESDRIAAVVANLRAIGADAEELPDGMRSCAARRRPCAAESRRTATTGSRWRSASLAPRRGNSIEIDDRDCVAVSYPNFWNDLASVTR